MKTTADKIKIQYDESGKGEILLSVSMSRMDLSKEAAELKAILEKGKKLAVEIKQHREARSLDANALMWIMAQKIAEAIQSTKEAIYKAAIRSVGQFEIMPIRNDAVERWIENWGGGRLGWFAETIGESKLAGYTNIISYYGSSVYNTKEMSRLIDEIIGQAKELGIETMPQGEIDSLIKEWGKEK
jgi:predicted transcriptional regulator